MSIDRSMKTAAIIAAAALAAAIYLIFCRDRTLRVEQIGEARFKDFYFTYSSTADPPKFQRYRFFKDGEERYFYHEKREGHKVFLTEDDITVSGTVRMTDEEWQKFWAFINNGAVYERTDDTRSGGSGPWLFIYWDGDRGTKQVLDLEDPASAIALEEFCEELKEREMAAR